VTDELDVCGSLSKAACQAIDVERLASRGPATTRQFLLATSAEMRGRLTRGRSEFARVNETPTPVEDQVGKRASVRVRLLSTTTTPGSVTCSSRTRAGAGVPKVLPIVAPKRSDERIGLRVEGDARVRVDLTFRWTLSGWAINPRNSVAICA
jgi:hypothetical protein